MANTTIQLKKSATPAATPASLANGELAINYADGKLFYKAANGSILSISGSSTNTFSTVNVNGTLVVSDSPTGILTLVPSGGITLAGDAINDKITIGMSIPTVNATSQTFTGNGSNTVFNLSSIVSNARNIIVTINGLIQIPTTHYTLSGNTITFTDAPVANSSIEARVLEGMIVSPGTEYTRTSNTATNNQTSFAANYASGNNLLVFVNGVLLNAADYTANNGTSVVLADATSANDVVEVLTMPTGGDPINSGTTGQLAYYSANGTTLSGAFSPNTTGNVLFSTDGTNWSSTAKIVRGTAVTLTNQTSVDFTGIPSWVKRITIMINAVSTNGTSLVIFQLGSTTFTTSGYVGYCNSWTGAIPTAITNGIGTTTNNAAVDARLGTLTLTNLTGNTWIGQGNFMLTTSTNGGVSVGTITLGGILDRVRMTTVNGTDTFDAGSVNILYE